MQHPCSRFYQQNMVHTLSQKIHPEHHYQQHFTTTHNDDITVLNCYKYAALTLSIVCRQDVDCTVNLAELELQHGHNLSGSSLHSMGIQLNQL